MSDNPHVLDKIRGFEQYIKDNISFKEGKVYIRPISQNETITFRKKKMMVFIS